MSNPESTAIPWPRLNKADNVVDWASQLVDQLQRPAQTGVYRAPAAVATKALPPPAEFEGRTYIILTDHNVTVTGGSAGDVLVSTKAMFVSDGFRWVQMI